MSALEKLQIRGETAKGAQNYSREQSQTRDAFAYKWARQDAYASEAVKANSRRWLFERYCDDDPARLAEWLSGERKIILDAGCGSGHSALLFFGDHLRNHDYLGVDISDAVEVAKTQFEKAGYPGDFLKMDLLELPIPHESVDIIFSEGVLHHTDSTERSIKSLARYLKKEGLFLFYVYKKKAVIREFTDDYIREQLKPLSDDETWEKLKPLTRLGIALGELRLEIEVPEDIPLLGITRGKIDIQRLFYWNICKLYYRPELSMEELNLANFDWFRPLNCHRHTPEEIEQWCHESGLRIDHMNIQEAGITVRARRVG